MKRFLLPLLALFLWAPNLAAQDEKKASEPYMHEMADGLQIQVYDTDTLRDETTDVLGIRLWKIRFSTQREGKQMMARLALRTPNGEPRQFLGMGLLPLSEAEFIFGLQPIDGDYFDASPKLRIYSRKGKHSGPGGDHRSYQTQTNPFLGLGNPSIPRKPLVRADGSILLVSFQPSGKGSDPENSELVVVVTLEDLPPAK